MNENDATGPRPLDHVVLPTAGLDVARERLRAIGFTVAPVGVHPFGTQNCCVYFRDGTFLEPLVIGDPALAGAAVAHGNVFVARDRAFRDSAGEEGFSALVLGTQDAAGDHARFEAAGVSAGPVLSFSRGFTDANGAKDTVSFKLAFCADRSVPDAFFFTCERVNAPAIDRGGLERHENGARAMAGVVIAATDPADCVPIVAALSGANTSANTFALPNGRIDILDRQSFADRFVGQTGPEGRLAAIVFDVESLAALKSLLGARGIVHEMRENRLVVPPAAGQGTVFAFQEAA